MSEWISVKDRLPENEDEYVLAIASGRPKENIIWQDAYVFAYYSPESGWYSDEYPEYEGFEVTYWTPLPEPPKEVD